MMIQPLTIPVVEDTHYPVSDSLPLGESPQHVKNIRYVVEPLEVWFADDAQAFVAANMFVYYQRGDNRRHVSPDLFVTLGIPKVTDPPRECYLLWQERKGPDVVIEFTSESTADVDRGSKRDLYRDVLRVREYFLFDPNHEFLDPPLQGFRLTAGDYQPIELVKGRLPSEVLQLHLEADGALLRFWNPATKAWLPIPPEVQQALTATEAARKQAEKARKKAEKAQAREAETRKQAEAARARAEEGKKQAEAEIERLRREIEDLRQRKTE